jgi:hypothetical protein
MRRTRARLLASAAVLATAGSASAALGLVATGTAPLAPAAGSDAGVGLDGGFDGAIPGSDAGIGVDAGTGTSIALQDHTLDILSMQGVANMATTTVYSPTMNTTLSFASISDPSFGIDLCGGLDACALNQSLPTPLSVICTPGPTQTQATLFVMEPGGGSDMAIVHCTPTGGGPLLHVSPLVIDYGSLPVGQTLANMVLLRNDGGVTLTGITISLGGNAGHWSVGACTPAQPCTLAPAQSVMVTITFQPAAHGDRSTMAEVVSDQTMMTPQSIDLRGTGLGGVMVITNPPLAQNGYHLDLGTIPRGQTTNAPITVRNDGNAMFTASVTNVAAPYSIAPSTPTDVAAGLTQDFVVSCGSATASANNDQTFDVTSNAYAGGNQQVTVHCAIANTLVQVDPLSFDFGEVRTNGGTMTRSMTLAVTNPASAAAPARIFSLQLRSARPGLTLTPAMTDTTLAPGASITATLELTNVQDTDLAGEAIEIVVDGELLALPVTGKVVTASSRIVPSELDLGTACVGSQVSGNVMLINDGTATLAVAAPEMDQSFVASSPGTPIALPPAMSLTAAVAPAMTASGSLAGTLTWHDDVPTDHSVPVRLEYVASGTALSPRGLDFGAVEAGSESLPQRLKLQNCDLATTKIEIESLKTKQGTLGAWDVQPRVGYTTQLSSKEEQAVSVIFRPPARGRYEADVTVRTASGRQIVHLVGDATGRDFDQTSFYACACSGPGAPQRGWPVVVAIAIVIARRRRGSS